MQTFKKRFNVLLLTTYDVCTPNTYNKLDSRVLVYVLYSSMYEGFETVIAPKPTETWSSETPPSLPRYSCGRDETN